MGLIITKLSNGSIEITGGSSPYTLLPDMYTFRDNSQIDGVVLASKEGCKFSFRASNVDTLSGGSGVISNPTGDQLYAEFKDEFFFAGKTVLYVRPAGGAYGLEDGSSYDNAWDGFTNVVWSEVEGNKLAVNGTHLETLTVGSNDVELIGNDVNESGVIDSQSVRTSGIVVTSKSDIVITALTAKNGIVQNLLMDGTTTIETTDCDFSFSGDQGLQHRNTVVATHNNCTSSNNTDDGISAHESCVITVNGGTFENNSEGIAVIDDSQVTLNGGITFSGNTVRDFSCRNTAQNIANNVTFATDVYLDGAVVPNVGNGLTFNNCTLNGLFVLDNSHNVEFNDSIINNNIAGSSSTNSIITVNRGLISSWAVNSTSIVNLFDTHIKRIGTAAQSINGTLNATRCFFNGANQTGNTLEIANGGTCEIIYSIFYNTSNFSCVMWGGSTISKFDNNTLVGKANVGKGVWSSDANVVNNCMFTDLDDVDNGTSVTYNNCNFFDNTNAALGTIIDSQTGDPLLTSVATFDFSLGVGSSCIANGKTLTETDIIDTSDWGDATTTPTITTSTQPTNWYIGAQTD